MIKTHFLTLLTDKEQKTSFLTLDFCTTQKLICRSCIDMKTIKLGKKIFSPKRRRQFNSREKDSGELSQTMIIISGLAVAGVVVAGGITAASLDSGEKSANCINNFSSFNSSVMQDDCSIVATGDGGTLIPGDGDNVVPGEPIEGGGNEGGSLVEYTPDECFEFSNGTITKYLVLENPISCSKDVVIPKEINGETVKSLGTASFSALNQVEDKSCPEHLGVLYTGNATLDNLAGIQQCLIDFSDWAENHNNGSFATINSVSFPDSLETIGEFSFYGQTSVNEVNLPGELNAIEKGAFNTAGLTGNLEIPNGLEKMGESAFYANNISSLSALPEKMTRVPFFAFSQNTNLKDVTLHEGISTIGYGSFSGTGIEEITFPESLVKIEREAFNGAKLKAIPELKNVTEIEEQAFARNEIGKDIHYEYVVPNTIEHIGKMAFSENYINSLKIPKGELTELGTRAFYKNEISELEFTESLKTIGFGAFEENNIKEVFIPKNSITVVDSSVFSENKVSKLHIPDTVEEIKNSAFKGHCIKEINIPRSVKSLGWFSFHTVEKDENGQSCNREAKINVPVETVVDDSAFFTTAKITRY